MPIISVEQLNKQFKIYRHREGLSGAVKDLFDRQYEYISAVKDINLTLNQGEMIGFIGANGAGKSTTIKMLTGILKPTSGQINVLGFNPHANREQYTRHIGVVFGQRSQLWWDIAVMESFRLLQKIYRVSEQDFQDRLQRFDELLGLAELLHLPVRKLSLGQRMRCELAASFLHNPPIIFLDEPTIGLDVLAKVRIREFLQEINALYQTTIILTTHDLGDIEALCSRVAIIDRGQKIYDGSLNALHREWNTEIKLEVELRERVSGTDWQKLFGDLPVSWEQTTPNAWTLSFQGERIPMAKVIGMLMEQMPVADLKPQRDSIEETVRKIYRQQEVG